jgi:hypothetical protein
MPRWNSHVRLSPDSCVSHVIVRATEIYKKCMCQLPTFLGNFSSENLEFAIFKIFLIATWNSRSEYYVFLVYQMDAPHFRIAVAFVDEFSRMRWQSSCLRDYWEFSKDILEFLKSLCGTLRHRRYWPKKPMRSWIHAKCRNAFRIAAIFFVCGRASYRISLRIYCLLIFIIRKRFRLLRNVSRSATKTYSRMLQRKGTFSGYVRYLKISGHPQLQFLLMPHRYRKLINVEGQFHAKLRRAAIQDPKGCCVFQMSLVYNRVCWGFVWCGCRIFSFEKWSRRLSDFPGHFSGSREDGRLVFAWFLGSGKLGEDRLGWQNQNGTF